MSKKKIFLFILLFLSFNYLENRATSSFLNKDVLLVAQWIWCIIGLIVFRYEVNNRLNTSKNRRYIKWFLLIMIISTLAPLLSYNQSVFSTLISQRTNYSICILLVLLFIHPSINDIFSTLKIMTLLSLAIFCYSIINPNLFLDPSVINDRFKMNSNDIGISGALPGLGLILAYFYYLGYKLIVTNKKSIQDLCVFIILMVLIILVQNRQSIIITFPIFVYSLFRIKNPYNKITLIFVLCVTLVVFGFNLKFILETLLEETINQLGNINYNRWSAINLYLFEWKYNIFNVFFGHGAGSINSSYTEELSLSNTLLGAYYQDIGFFGSFFLYGIFFIILSYYFIFQGFFNRNMPLYIKFWCFGLIILPIYNNWGLMNNSSAVTFALLIYLVLYNKQYNQMRVQKNENLSHYY